MYEVIKGYDGRWTIGECVNEDTVIINDGIYGYYWWEAKEKALRAAKLCNKYGTMYLGDHGAGGDQLSYRSGNYGCPTWAGRNG